MLFLLLPLLAVVPGDGNADGLEEPVSFHVIHIASFYNHSWKRCLSSGWLSDLQTHAWDRNSSTIIFLWPWSRGNFSNGEWKELEMLFRIRTIQLFEGIPRHAHELQFEYPFEIQVTGGCKLHSGKVSGSFLRLAYQGSDFVRFQNNSWLPYPAAGNRAKHFCKVANQNQHENDITHSLLSDTCPRFILGLLDAGKAYLQRQVKPEAWLSGGPSPGPGHLQLVCHVSGFYPKPVWVMWTRGEQEQQGTQRGDILPSADGTWYLRATLEVAAGEAAGLSCRVKHSSLEGQDIVLYWEHHSSVGLIILAVIVPLLLLTGLALWFRKCCFC
ncbi:T-cell surface glycoprotein CD1a isoform X1 [Nomascus leucogenys]|uniref:T-cell surface glycoprotein CD1a isoform X1 n=1 Tax=Nomascus leucogenys TaxID=61853 RepID=UPI00122DAC11|nr:T-cell surface glycoprotein CD1a isoform X1 [Nomascus leucogenys]